MTPLGRVGEIFRYPVKSMAGIAAGSAFLGWHGLEGDRRFAFCRVGDESGFQWLTATKIPRLLLYKPLVGGGGEELLPPRVAELIPIAAVFGPTSISTPRTRTFFEHSWLGGTIVFDNGPTAPTVPVTQRDVRCMMINLDPETAEQDARVLKKVVELNSNNAGVYGTVLQTGTISVGASVYLASAAAPRQTKSVDRGLRAG